MVLRLLSALTLLAGAAAGRVRNATCPTPLIQPPSVYMLPPPPQWSLPAPVSPPLGATVKDCGAGTSLFKIQGLGLTPVSPAPGDPITLHLEYDVPEGTLITDGTTTYQITLNFIPFAPSTNPLCQDIPCPLGAGSYKNDTTSTWPSGVSGSFTSKMTWADPAGQQLLCVQISGSLADEAAPAPVAVMRKTPRRLRGKGASTADVLTVLQG